MSKYLFLGHGPICARLIQEIILKNQDHEIAVYSKRTKKPSSPQICFLDNWKDVDLNNTDVVVNSWKTLYGDYERSRHEILTEISQKLSDSRIFVNLSSVAVYGECQSEADENSRLTPVNEYGMLKLQLEKFLKEIEMPRLWNLRLSNVFGDASFDDVVNRAYMSAIHGKTLGMFAPSMVRRDFIRVDQVVKYVINLLETNVFKFSNGFIDVNVSSGESLYLTDVLVIVEAVLGRKPLVDMFLKEEKMIIESRISNKRLRSLSSVPVSSPEADIRDYFHWLKMTETGN